LSEQKIKLVAHRRKRGKAKIGVRGDNTIEGINELRALINSAEELGVLSKVTEEPDGESYTITCNLQPHQDGLQVLDLFKERLTLVDSLHRDLTEGLDRFEKIAIYKGIKGSPKRLAPYLGNWQPKNITLGIRVGRDLEKLCPYLDEQLGVSLEDMRSNKKRGNIALAEAVLSLVFYTKYGGTKASKRPHKNALSYQDIGNLINKHHSTILFATRKFRPGLHLKKEDCTDVCYASKKAILYYTGRKKLLDHNNKLSQNPHKS